ncbi:MAG TPA: ABC transporter permease [Candidatus Aquicultor sp.]|jgi:ABC-2 type transport system permease protein
MRFVAMTLASIKMTVRNRQALFFLFLFPILFILLFGVIFSNDQGNASISVVRLDNSSLATSITDGLGKVDKLSVTQESRSKAIDRLKNGKVDAVLVLNKGFAKGFPERPAQIELYYDPSSTKSQMMRGTVSAVLSGMERAMIKTPPLIAVISKSVQSDQLNYIDFLLPGVLAMSLMNSGLYGIATATVSRREKGVLRRIKLTPMPLREFIGAGIINQLIVSILQSALLIAVGYFVFGVHLTGSLISLAVVVTVGSLCFITIGFVIASFAKTADSASTLGNIIGMPMMFLGGVFFPVDNAPAWIQPLIKVIPLTYLANSLRDVMVRGQDLATQQSNLLILLAVTAVMFAVSIVFFRWESEAK